MLKLLRLWWSLRLYYWVDEQDNNNNEKLENNQVAVLFESLIVDSDVERLKCNCRED